MKLGVAITDIVTGLNAVQVILAALIARERTGTRTAPRHRAFRYGGRHAREHRHRLSQHRPRSRPLGNAHPTIVPYQVFPTADGRP
jgi:crotonobetainyl-CoA:carnitine CoA-transferase CaiB-like acyl-CoA transferase